MPENVSFFFSFVDPDVTFFINLWMTQRDDVIPASTADERECVGVRTLQAKSQLLYAFLFTSHNKKISHNN